MRITPINYKNKSKIGWYADFASWIIKLIYNSCFLKTIQAASKEITIKPTLTPNADQEALVSPCIRREAVPISSPGRYFPRFGITPNIPRIATKPSAIPPAAA
jgi:hypothetical protein